MGIYEIIIEYIFENKEMPYYSAERRLDPIFGIFIEDILSSYLKTPILYVTAEFPLKLKNNQSNEIDYLCKSKEKNTVWLVELKTDEKSYSEKQLNFYKNKNDWHKIIKDFKNKARNLNIDTDDRVKYYNLIKRLKACALIEYTREELIEEIDKILDAKEKQSKTIRSKKIRDLVESIKTIPMNVKVMYIGPPNKKFEVLFKKHNIDFISFEMLKKQKINTQYPEELKLLLKGL